MTSSFKLVVLLAFLVTCTTAKPRNPPSIMGHNQNKINTLLNTLAEGKWKALSVNGYNPDFRPPTSSSTDDDDIQPNPTIVKISFKDMFVKSLNLSVEGEERVEVRGSLASEYVDSRLQFTPPQDHPEVIRTDYSSNIFASMKIWKPNFKLDNDDSDFNYNTALKTLYANVDDVTRFNQNGEVYDRKVVKIVPQRPVVISKNNTRFTFGVEISDRRFPIEDVMLEVREQDSLTLRDNEGGSSTIVRSGSGEKYRFTPSFGKCKRVENYGGLGKEEFSCLKLEFAFELV